MILRRFTQHLKDQNWFAVGLDVVVVIFGVYLGIFIGNEVQRNAEADEVSRNLASMQIDLSADILAVNQIIESQTQVKESFTQVVQLLLLDKPNEESMREAMATLTSIDTPTFYPDISSYSTIVSSGHLTKIAPNELRHKITRLFEYTYKRHSEFAKLYDTNVDSIYKEIISRYWDRNKLTLLVVNPLEKDIFRSSLQGQISYTDGYISFLKNMVLPPMVSLNQALQE